MEVDVYEQFDLLIGVVNELKELVKTDKSVISSMDFDLISRQLEDLKCYYEEKDQQNAFECEVVSEKNEQLAEANELLHHLFNTFCDKDDCNEITDYFDKWGV